MNPNTCTIVDYYLFNECSLCTAGRCMLTRVGINRCFLVMMLMRLQTQASWSWDL